MDSPYIGAIADVGRPVLMLLGEFGLRHAVVLALGLALSAALRSHSAARRHAVLGWALAAGLMMPIVDAFVPSLSVPVFPGQYRPDVWYGDPLAGLRGSTVGVDLSRQGLERLQTPGGPPSGRPAATANPVRDRLPAFLLVIWAAGCAFLGTKHMIGVMMGVRIRRRSRPLFVNRQVKLGAEAILETGLKRSVGIFVGPVDLPIVAGIIKPAVILPMESSGWEDERLRFVVRHELAHVIRRDSLVQFMASLVCTLYWFNPLAWMVAARTRLERELACDDRVLAADVRASAYATHLLAIARSIQVHAPTVVAMAHPSHVERRLVAILSSRNRREPVSPFLRQAIGAMSLCTLTLMATVDPWASADPVEQYPSFVLTAGNTPLSPGTPRPVRLLLPGPAPLRTIPAPESETTNFPVSPADGRASSPPELDLYAEGADSVRSFAASAGRRAQKTGSLRFPVAEDRLGLSRAPAVSQARESLVHEEGRFAFGLGGELVHPRGTMTRTSRGLRARGLLRIEEGTSLEMTLGYTPMRVVATVDQIEGFRSDPQTVYDTQSQFTVGLGLRRLHQPEAVRSLYWSFAGGLANVPGTALVSSSDLATPVALDSKWGYFIQPRIGLVFVARHLPALAMDVSAGLDVISWGSYSAIQQTFTFGLNYSL